MTEKRLIPYLHVDLARSIYFGNQVAARTKQGRVQIKEVVYNLIAPTYLANYSKGQPFQGQEVIEEIR